MKVGTGLVDPILTSATVRRDLGGISHYALAAWQRDLGFPDPDIIIAGRKYWHRSTVQGWLDAQKGRAALRRCPAIGAVSATELAAAAGD